jgi:hypothetical protein
LPSRRLSGIPQLPDTPGCEARPKPQILSGTAGPRGAHSNHMRTLERQDCVAVGASLPVQERRAVSALARLFATERAGGAHRIHA